MIRSIHEPKPGSFFSVLMSLITNDGRKWIRINRSGEESGQSPFVVVSVALREFQLDARAAIETGLFTVAATGATYQRENNLPRLSEDTKVGDIVYVSGVYQ